MHDFVTLAREAISHLADDDRLTGTDFVLEQRVIDDGQPEIVWHLRLADGRADIIDGPADVPDVIFRQDRATAEAMQRGEVHAQEAFLTGRLRVDGNIDKLLAHGDLFGELTATPRA